MNGGAISGWSTAILNRGRVAPRCWLPLNEYMNVALASFSETLSLGVLAA
jgi:hypothetical protein